MAETLLHDRLVPGTLASLVLIGAYYGQTPLVALATTLLLTIVLTRFWSRHSLHAVRYERETSDDRAFPGDELLLTLRLTNDKLLPLPWVEVNDRVPDRLSPTPTDGTPASTAVDGRLRLACSISWHERITWRYRLHCQHRGIYRLGTAVAVSGDPFGFFPRAARVGKSTRLVVYPRLIPLDRLGIPSDFPIGETRPRRWIFEDPSRTVGVRDYRRDDPFRRIHWKATARRQELQVRVHEPTTTLETVLFLGLDTFPSPATDHAQPVETRDLASLQPQAPSSAPTSDAAADRSPDVFEHAVSVVASLAHELIGQGHPVGLYLNGGIAGSTDPLELPPGGSQDHLIDILELLAGVEPLPCIPVEALLAQVAPRLPWGASVVVVVGSLPESLMATLQALRRAGRRPVAILVGDGSAPESPDVFRVAPDA